MTTIEDTVTYADGSLANGRLVVYWKPFTVNSVQVGGGELQYEIVNGAVLVSLYSNQTAQPLGSYYNAKYELENGPVYVEQWIVPNYPTVNIGQCKVSFPPTPSVIISPLQLSSLGGQPGMFLEWDGSKWTPAYPSTFNMTPNWIGLVAGTTGTDINIVGSPAAVGNSMTINIPSASATARGVVTTGAQTFAGNKTFTGNLTVTGTVTLPANSYVPVGRMINTGAGLTGGGSLSADLTLAAVPLTASGSTHSAGYAPDPGPAAGNTRYLREDAVWVLPPFSPVQSVFGRTGVIVAVASDYAVYYVAVATQVIAGAGMTGGGALTGDVTLNAAVTSVFGRTGAVVLTPADIGAAGGVPATRQILTGTGLTGGGDLTADRTLSVVTDTTTQRLEAALGGTLVAARRQFNFIAGSGQTINVVDNPSFNRVDITLNTSGTGPASPSIYAVNGTAIGTRPELNLVAGTNTTLAGVDNSGANRVDITVTSVGSGAVASVFGRSGAVVAVAGDYTAAQVTNAVSILGSYADPAWITSLAYGKLTGVPSVSSMQTPWLSNINAASYNLDNLGHLGVGIASQASTGIYVYRPSGGVTYPVFVYSVSLNNYGVMHQESDATGLAGFAAINDSSKYGGFAIYGSNYASSTYRNNTAFLASGDLMIETGTTYVERMRITAAGRVGIGTASPGYMLDVSGDCNLSAGSVYRIGGVPLSTGGGFWVAGSGGAIYYNGGNVGIGTTGPQTKLGVQDVVTTSMVAEFCTDDGVPANQKKAGISMGVNQVQPFAALYGFQTGSNNYGEGDLIVSTATGGALTERMRVKNTGSVGIGTASPLALLDLRPVAYAPSVSGGIKIADVGNNWPAGIFIRADASGTPRLALDGPTKVDALVLSAGNVGIGTTSPGAPLEIDGVAVPLMLVKSTSTTATPAIEIRDAAATPHRWWLASGLSTATDGTFAIYDVANGARLAITQAGNVGIGTTSPSTLLTVQSANGAPVSCYLWQSGIGSGHIGFKASDHTMYVVNSYSDGTLANGKGIAIDLNGNVGIGTTSPVGPLSLGNPASDTGLRPWSNMDQGVVAFYQAQNFPAANAYQRVLDIVAGGLNVGGNIRFVTQAAGAAGVAAMLINPAGNVGIGTTSPNAVVEVAASLSAQGTYQSQWWSASVANCLKLQTVWDASGIYYKFVERGGGTDYNVLTFLNGNVGIGTTSPATTLHVNGAVCIGSGGAASGTAGDLNLSRNVAPAQGAIFFGNSGAYIYWDGAKWNFNPVGPGGGITTQSVVTGSRAAATNYQNTTGKPMMVNVGISLISGTIIGYSDSSSNPTTVVSNAGVGGGTGQTIGVTFWVLPGNYYKVVGGTPSYWIEWT